MNSYHRVRGALLLTLAAVTLISPLLLTETGPPRVLLSACVLLLAPGAAVVGFGRLRDGLTELVITIAVSVTVDVLASVAMLALVPRTFEVLFIALVCVCAPIIAWHGARAWAGAGRHHARA